MAEHSARYADFAKFLTDNGIAVYVSDHRGHGRTITDMKDYGVWPHRDEWWRIIGDLKLLKDIASTENPGLPYYVLGHSMGSFLARTFITRYSTEISGVIISGTGTNPASSLPMSPALSRAAAPRPSCSTNCRSAVTTKATMLLTSGFRATMRRLRSTLPTNFVEDCSPIRSTVDFSKA